MEKEEQQYHKILMKYTRKLKAELKVFSGQKIEPNTSLSWKLKVYTKLKKLNDKINAKDDIDWVSVNKRIRTYYSTLESELKEFDLGSKTSDFKTKQSLSKEQTKNDKSSKELRQEEVEKEEVKGEVEEDEEEEEEEIGPTPQLHGRVLNLFDIQTSPEKVDRSPTKKQSVKLDLGIKLEHEFKTPTKLTKIKQVVLETPIYLRKETQMLNIDSLDDSDDSDYANDMETILKVPKFDALNEPDVMDPNFKVDPSPLFKRKGKSLFEMHNEISTFKKNLTGLLKEDGNGTRDEYEEDDDDFNIFLSNKKENINDEDENEDIVAAERDLQDIFSDEDGNSIEITTNNNESASLMKYRAKAKTIKRSTRRVKMKTTRLIESDDEFENVDIHNLISPNDNRKEITKEISDDENEDDDENKDKYTRMDFTELLERERSTKSTGKHPLSNNFVRMKIHRGKRRRR